MRRPLAWSPNPGASALSLAEQIAEQVGNAIIRGELAPGARVLEEEMAARFAVSRGPVREALRILERDGLIRIQARRGARVTQLTIDEVDEVFELRRALLGLAARRLARRADPATHAAVRAGVEQLKVHSRGDDADAYVVTAQELNLAIAGACGSELLRAMYFSLAYRTVRYTRLSLATERRRMQSARKWKSLSSAMEAGDEARAGELAEALVRDSRDAVVAILRSQSNGGVPADEEGTDREPGRDRLPDHSKLPRARPADGRRLL
jgi:DNA-binding GntR family transcriptional regulator